MTTTPSVRLYTETTLSPEQQRILNSTPTRTKTVLPEPQSMTTVPSGLPKHRHPLPGIVQAGTTIPHVVPAKSVWERG